MKRTELEQVLNFIYLGQTNIKEEEVAKFLAVSEDLGLEGLGDIQTVRNILETAPEPSDGPPDEIDEGKVDIDWETVEEDVSQEEDDDRVPVMPSGMELEELEEILASENNEKTEFDESFTPTGWQAESDTDSSEDEKEDNVEDSEPNKNAQEADKIIEKYSSQILPVKTSDSVGMGELSVETVGLFLSEVDMAESDQVTEKDVSLKCESEETGLRPDEMVKVELGDEETREAQDPSRQLLPRTYDGKHRQPR